VRTLATGEFDAFVDDSTIIRYPVGRGDGVRVAGPVLVEERDRPLLELRETADPPHSSPPISADGPRRRRDDAARLVMESTTHRGRANIVSTVERGPSCPQPKHQPLFSDQESSRSSE